MLSTLICAAGVAKADVVYSSASAFTAATTGLSSPVTFGTDPYTGSGYTAVSNPYSVGAVTFSATGGALHINSDYVYTHNPGSTPYGSGDYLIAFGNSPTQALTITFPASTAFGLNIGGTNSANEEVGYSYTTVGGSTVTGSFVTPDYIADGKLDFFGLTTSSPLTSITFQLEDDQSSIYGDVDNVAYGSAATPEPGTLSLMGTGLLAVGGLVRRRLKK